MNMQMSRRGLLGATAGFAAVSAFGGRALAFGPVVPSDYPSLDTEALGQLNRFHSLARQMPGDWAGMGIEAVAQDGDDALHWQMPFMSYGLAVAQYSRTPAYRELYRDSIDRLTEKMRRTEVWNYWEEASTGEDVFQHNHNLIRPADGDPLKFGNVEYSGNALSMMALYELLYKDGKWDAANAFELKRLKPTGLETFDYNLPKLTDVSLQQFKDSGYLGMECEPDGIYPTTCNVFPIHAFMAYDATHGTHYAADVIPKHIEAWQKISGLYRTDGDGAAAFGLYPSRAEMRLSDPYTWGKLQFINVYAPEYAAEIYPKWREQLFDIDSSGTLVLKPQAPAPLVEMSGHQHDMPRRENRTGAGPEFFGSVEQLAHKVGPVAAEMGDPELQAAALKFLAAHNPAVWENGEMFYDRNDAHGTPEYMTRRGNIVIGSGRVWSKNAYYDLYNRPWTTAMLQTPEVRDIEYPKVLVQQAFYDPAKDALVVTLLPHGVLPDSRQPKVFDTQFTIANLDPAKQYEIARGGQTIARVAGGAIMGGAADGTVEMGSAGPRIRASLHGEPLSYVITAVRG